MDEKTSIILRDLLLEAIENYREEEDDLDTEYYYHIGKLMKKTKEGFLDLELNNDINEKTKILFRDMNVNFLKRLRGDDPNSDEYYSLSQIMEKFKDGYIDLKTIGYIDFIKDLIYSNQDTFDHYLASAYAKELCSLIPDATERATKLLSKITYKDMDSIAERYMEEASKCYIYGFFLAAAIMCRGSIEYSLKKYLGITDSNGDIERYSIHFLLNEAINKPGPFNKGDKRIVLNIHNGASDCVHGRGKIDSVKCLDYINNTKLIIEKLLR